MRLFPIDAPGGPPDDLIDPELRGIAIYWVAPGLAHSPAWQKFTPKIPEPTWYRRAVPFTAMTIDGADRPPETTVETERMVHHACAIVSVHHTVPSGSLLYYEVGTWSM